MFRTFDVSFLAPAIRLESATVEATYTGDFDQAVAHIARALAREGAHVSLFCDIRDASVDSAGIRYFPMNAWPDYAKATLHDVCIVQRTPERFYHQTNARLNLLWCQDLALR